jgi:hypothetical protein
LHQIDAALGLHLIASCHFSLYSLTESDAFTAHTNPSSITFRVDWNEFSFLNARICCKMRMRFPAQLQPTCIQFAYTQRRGAAINGATTTSLQFATDFKVREICVVQKRIQPKPVQRERFTTQKRFLYYTEDIILLCMTPCRLGDIYQWSGRASRFNLLYRRVSSSS